MCVFTIILIFYSMYLSLNVTFNWSTIAFDNLTTLIDLQCSQLKLFDYYRNIVKTVNWLAILLLQNRYVLYINLCISFVFQAQVTDLTKFLFPIGLQICYDRRSIVQSVRKRIDSGVCGRSSKCLSLVFGAHCLAKWCHKLSSSCKYTSSVQRANLFLSSLLYSKLFNFFSIIKCINKKKETQTAIQTNCKSASWLQVCELFSYSVLISIWVFVSFHLNFDCDFCTSSSALNCTFFWVLLCHLAPAYCMWLQKQTRNDKKEKKTQENILNFPFTKYVIYLFLPHIVRGCRSQGSFSGWWSAALELHRLYAQLYDRVPSALRRVDWVHVGLHVRGRCLLHSVLLGYRCHRQSCGMYSTTLWSTI